MPARHLLPLMFPLSLVACSVFEEGSQAPKAVPEGSGGSGPAEGGGNGDGDGNEDGSGSDGAGPNTPPGAATIALSPDRPGTDDDVRVVIVAEAADAEGDAVRYRYVWVQDGALRGDLIADTLPAAETQKGEVWRVQVVANDGLADGGVAEAEVTVVNAPPTVSVSLPAAVDTLADLEAVAEAADRDGDTVTFAYVWSVDGRVTPWVEASVPASATSRGEVWTVTAVANDGEEDGAPATASVTVGNTLPTLGGVRLDPSPAFEDSALRAVVEGADDVDGDALSFVYAWLVNGAAVSGVLGDSLTGADFNKGDSVVVRATVSDPVGAGGSAESSALTIANSLPTAPVVSISPAEAVEGDELVCGLVSPATDVDGDSLSYAFTWTVDGVAYTDAVDGVRVGDTVVAGEALASETWACAVTAGDGSASGLAGADEVLVESAYGSVSVSLTASGIEFVTVYGGTFNMGCTPGQSSCSGNESPAQTTTLTRDYYMGRTEVTQDQFSAMMGYNPSSFATACGSTCPVEQVTWHEAAAFANAVSAAAGLARCYTCTGSGTSVSCSAPSSVYSCTGYRLPTEAEWEGAARCGQDLLYAGSATIDAVAWYSSNSSGRTHAVASKGANACGLYDMSGNVYEWTNDWYGAYASGGVSDPSGPASGSIRVFRGGSWSGGPPSARVAFRYDFSPAYRDVFLGFRLVRTAD